MIRFTLIHAIFLLSTQFLADWLSNRVVKSFVTEMVLAKFVFFSDLKIKTDFAFSDSSLEILRRFWSESGKKQTWKMNYWIFWKIIQIVEFSCKMRGTSAWAVVPWFLGILTVSLNIYFGEDLLRTPMQRLMFQTSPVWTSPRIHKIISRTCW